MADSPSHKLGQIVGNLLEEILLPQLLSFCEERELYLDRHGDRKGVRGSKKVTWPDKYGNNHDLDFVIEKAGSPAVRGIPVAFIEAAWRRYTKHSKNKAQEIQGAVLPIADLYSEEKPFLGAVLAGEFTKPSLEQLKSVGFEVLYIPYESIVQSFNKIEIDFRFDEKTSDADFQNCVDEIMRMSPESREVLKNAIFENNKKSFDKFFKSVEFKLDRVVKNISVTPLYGRIFSFESIEQAFEFIESHNQNTPTGEFQRFEISVRFSNDDEIRASFKDTQRAKDFLSRFLA